MDRWEMRRQTEDKILKVAPYAACVAELPQWLLDLADRLGVERPAVDVRRWPASSALAEGEAR